MTFRGCFTTFASLVVAATILARPSDAGDTYTETRTITVADGGLRCTHRHDWSIAQRHSASETADPFSASNDYAFLECVRERDERLMFHVPSPALMVLSISSNGGFIVGLSRLRDHNPYQIVVFGADGKPVFMSRVTNKEACFDEATYVKLLAKYPKDREQLSQRSTVVAGKTYVDFETGSSDFSPKLNSELSRKKCRSHVSSGVEDANATWVNWYDERHPDIELVSLSGAPPTGVRLRDRLGVMITVPFE